MLDLLAVGAHPDDVEIGMGGSLATLVARGQQVGILDLTDGEPTPTGSPEARLEESRQAAAVLGVSWRETLELPNRYLQDSIENRKRIAAVLRRVRPRLVAVPYWIDAHPDHVAACQLMEAAAFYTKLTKSDIPGEPAPIPRMVHYFCNHYRLHPHPSFVLDISGQLEAKLQAVRVYRSQFNEERRNLGIFERVAAHARYWGGLIGAEAGEVFFSREPLRLTSFDSLCGL
ncbi:bacillithiol biosynthesis deacetylase BshB1 [bacterium CPR1]|nr:bacillithiol biosynthesis deacetylase BshB1 [bacterium CPR1]